MNCLVNLCVTCLDYVQEWHLINDCLFNCRSAKYYVLINLWVALSDNVHERRQTNACLLRYPHCQNVCTLDLGTSWLVFCLKEIIEIIANFQWNTNKSPYFNLYCSQGVILIRGDNACWFHQCITSHCSDQMSHHFIEWKSFAFLPVEIPIF